jgi:dTDP-4-dehydrorhamnose 3,5-epimerase
MQFEPLALSGLMRVRSQAATDARGSFSRAFCADEFAAHGLENRFLQDSISLNREAGTLRGLHFQKKPHQETKFVQCLRGAIFDVAVDLRRFSSTFGRWAGVTLRAEEPGGLYIPPGFAHGFLTLTNDSLVYYKITPAYLSGMEGGLRWNDDRVGIEWPSKPWLVSERDEMLPGWTELADTLSD